MKINICGRCGTVVREIKDPKYRILEAFPYVRRGSRTLWLCPECQVEFKKWIEEGKHEQSERK